MFTVLVIVVVVVLVFLGIAAIGLYVGGVKC